MNEGKNVAACGDVDQLIILVLAVNRPEPRIQHLGGSMSA
jgi:hypothetical protein